MVISFVLFVLTILILPRNMRLGIRLPLDYVYFFFSSSFCNCVLSQLIAFRTVLSYIYYLSSKRSLYDALEVGYLALKKLPTSWKPKNGLPKMTFTDF